MYFCLFERTHILLKSDEICKMILLPTSFLAYVYWNERNVFIRMKLNFFIQKMRKTNKKNQFILKNIDNNIILHTLVGISGVAWSICLVLLWLWLRVGFDGDVAQLIKVIFLPHHQSEWVSTPNTTQSQWRLRNKGKQRDDM